MEEIIIKSKSICTSCKNVETCIYLKDANSPILHCKEFELVPTQISQEQNNKVEIKDELCSIEYTGLCIICDNRDECDVRCKTSVIWHCEEYA